MAAILSRWRWVNFHPWWSIGPYHKHEDMVVICIFHSKRTFHDYASCSYQRSCPHHLQNHNNVYACMLDATKAFDKVSFTKLFALLLKHDIPAIKLRAFQYTVDSVAASCNGILSKPFSVTNGVRQGGHLSRLLVGNLLENCAMLMISQYFLPP